MTTTPPTPTTPPTAPVLPEDPYPNKAVVAAVVTIVTLIVQMASSDWKLSLDQEGITAIGGAVSTILVWAVSNWRRYGA